MCKIFIVLWTNYILISFLMCFFMGYKRNKFKINNVKINIIFTLLFISNIILYLVFINNFYSDKYFQIPFGTLNNIITMVSAIIILGFISTRLPQFRKLGDSSIYEVCYLIIIGILSMVVSYFNKSSNTEAIIAPYMEMFKVLSVMLIFMLITTKIKPFKNIMRGKVTKKNQFLCLVIFSILGCIASLYHVYVGETPANVRTLIIMIGGLFGGPFVGIPSGIIAGVFRFAQGGVTAFPCAIATVLSGVVGSLVYVWNGKKILRSLHSILLMFYFIGFEMLLIVILTPNEISFQYIEDIYPLMLFASVMGMALFLMIVREQTRPKKEISYEELRMNEMENTLEEHIDRIEELEEEIQELKNKDSD